MNFTKLVIFDLDGVLIDSKSYHYEALNNALEAINPKYKISEQEHAVSYDGLPTKSKLSKLHIDKGLPEIFFDRIWDSKQKETLLVLKKNVLKDDQLIKGFKNLKKKGYVVAVASNSIRATIEITLRRLGVLEFVDFYLSHEDVRLCKPHPEIFWECMVRANSIPETTVIIEDSNFGRAAATNSGAFLLAVDSRNDLDDNFFGRIILTLSERHIKNKAWKSDNLNILIPMAGGGSRFQAKGFTFPKPLIDVKGKPMIQVVVDNLNIDAHFIFIVQKAHYEKYNLKYLLNLVAPNCDIVQVDGLTEGAACTTLLAKNLIDNENSLLLANSDQFIEWNSNEALYAFNNSSIDAGIITFESIHPKWSYVKLGDNGYAVEVAEKKPISKHATAGIYYWKKGSDYVLYAEQMINKNIRVNNEFYVCPVFNEAINDKKKIRIYEIPKEGMWGLGTPEDLNYFIENNKLKI
jgi:beta-phosphoglucomutase-like phosphatase (HAD superfamily)/dTDP-glucose pyrophosphorylase